LKVKTMRIGLLASKTGIAASRIRFYEARGLLPRPERRGNGYRDYDGRALEVLLFIDRARRLGFSLSEVEAHLTSPRDSGRKARLLSKIEGKLAEIDAQAAEIEKRRATLLDLVAELRSLHPPE
jgi:MerR family transcriptional regulator, copper efflux regulator